MILFGRVYSTTNHFKFLRTWTQV